ncbi:MAG: 1-acyl-sn-glycerol-3-phosphate acyltransferase [Duodenibacillus sp.]|nr:1-acyl-sn-glycerol-3-phosphate acyltransferase [Duodenibacillus sp.]
MNKLGAYARFASIFVYILGALWTVCVSMPLSSPENRRRLLGVWGRRLVAWMGATIEVKGRENICPEAFDTGLTPGSAGRMIASNHVSVIDVFALNGTLPSSFVAKAEIGRWPVLGTIARGIGTIFIERGNRRKLVEIGETLAAALGQGLSLLFFPEGTTGDGKRLLKMHANLFESAVKAQAPIIPVAVRYLSRGVPVADKIAYTGGVGMFECLWKVIEMPDLVIEINILPEVKAADRREACRLVSAAISGALGFEDPLAEPAQQAGGDGRPAA